MAFYRFYNILKTQKSTSAIRDPIGVNICNLTSNLEITASGLKRTKLVPWKPARTFSSPKIAKNAV